MGSVQRTAAYIIRDFYGLANVPLANVKLAARNYWFNLEDARREFQTCEAFAQAVHSAIAATMAERSN